MRDERETTHHVHDVRRFDRKHAAASFLGKGTHNQCLTCARRAEEETSSHIVFFEQAMLECSRMEQRQRDNSPYRVNGVFGQVHLAEGGSEGSLKGSQHL